MLLYNGEGNAIGQLSYHNDTEKPHNGDNAHVHVHERMHDGEAHEEDQSENGVEAQNEINMKMEMRETNLIMEMKKDKFENGGKAYNEKDQLENRDKDEFENRDEARDNRDELENDNEEKDGFGNGDKRDELENGGEMNLTDMKTDGFENGDLAHDEEDKSDNGDEYSDKFENGFERDEIENGEEIHLKREMKMGVKTDTESLSKEGIQWN